MERTTERRARLATFGVALAAAALACAMNRIQVTRQDSVEPGRVKTLTSNVAKAEPTATDVVAFG